MAAEALTASAGAVDDVSRVQAPRRHWTVLRGGVLVLGSTLVWHASNFGVNAVAAHALGPSGYGSVTAVVAAIAFATPVFVAVQTVTSRMTTRLAGEGEWGRVRPLLGYYGLRLAIVLGFCGLLLVAGSSAVARFLRIGSAGPVALLAPVLVFGMVTHLQRGVLQGTQRFGRYAASTLVEGATKLAVSAALLVVVWRSVDAAVLALVVASVAAAIVNWTLLRFLPVSERAVQPRSASMRYSALTLGSLTLLALLLAADVVAAKRYLPAHEAGVYSAVSLTGKIVFFATSALAVYVFPYFSARRDAGRDARRLLAFVAGLVAAGAAAITLLYSLAPAAIVSPLFGSEYRAADPYLPQMAVAFGCYAIAYLAAMYLLAHERSGALFVLGGALIAQLFGFLTFHTTIGQLIHVECAVFAAAAVLLCGLCVRSERRCPESASVTP